MELGRYLGFRHQVHPCAAHCICRVIGIAPQLSDNTIINTTQDDMEPTEMDSEKVPVTVHLVHGTWPYGVFCRSRAGSHDVNSKSFALAANTFYASVFRTQSSEEQHVWFEEGSAFRNRITQLAGDDISINYEVFRWSGKNSFAARQKAAEDLCLHLRKTIDEHATSKHVIIAHSHGGTVLATALSSPGSSDLLTAISWAACMATPFAYAIAAPKDQLVFFAFSLFLVVLPFQLLLFGITHGAIQSIIPAIPLVGLIWAFVGRSRPSKFVTSPEPNAHGSVQLFLLRATRDEASLAIGLAQSLNWLLTVPIRWWGGGWRARTKVLIVALLGAPVFIYAVNLLPLPKFWKGFMMDLPTAIGGALYLVGYALVALSVGFYDIRSWPYTTVEIDSSPPWWPATMINLAEETNPNERRHSIHMRQEVSRRLVAMLRCLQ